MFLFLKLNLSIFTDTHLIYEMLNQEEPSVSLRFPNWFELVHMIFSPKH